MSDPCRTPPRPVNTAHSSTHGYLSRPEIEKGTKSAQRSSRWHRGRGKETVQRTSSESSTRGKGGKKQREREREQTVRRGKDKEAAEGGRRRTERRVAAKICAKQRKKFPKRERRTKEKETSGGSLTHATRCPSQSPSRFFFVYSPVRWSPIPPFSLHLCSTAPSRGKHVACLKVGSRLDEFAAHALGCVGEQQTQRGNERARKLGS